MELFCSVCGKQIDSLLSDLRAGEDGVESTCCRSVVETADNKELDEDHPKWFHFLEALYAARDYADSEAGLSRVERALRRGVQ